VSRWSRLASVAGTVGLSHLSLLAWVSRDGPLPQAAAILQDTAAVPAIEFATPPFDLPAELRDTIRFGWLTVPADHADPGAGTIRLAFAIIAARTSDPAPDPIILVPGGPGSAHVAPATVEVARSARAGLHRRHRALVLLDPRGHGLSEPDTCGELGTSMPLQEADTASARILAEKLTACRSRLLAQGVDLRALSSTQTAWDLESLRRALRAPQLNLVGGSYGSRIVAEAMRQVPWAIRAAMVYGPVPPGLGATDAGASIPDLMDTLFGRCAEQPECHAAFPRLEADYDSVLARVSRSPLTIPVPRSDAVPDGLLRVDQELLRPGLAELGYTREIAAAAPMLIHALAERGVESLRPMALPLMSMLLPADTAFGTYLAFTCNDQSERLEHPSWMDRQCPRWVGEPWGDTLALPLESDVPMLILAGELDPRTPPANGRFLASGLSRARFLVLPWTGHVGLPDCAFRITDQFFRAPELAPSTSCLDSIPPIRFVTDVVPSRWISGTSARAATRPTSVAIPVGAAFVLLLVAFVGLTVGALIPRWRGRGGRLDWHTLAPWLTALVGIGLLVSAGAAVVAGTRQSPLLPAVGVPAGWGWVRVLPWLLLVLTLVTLVSVVTQRREHSRSALLLRWGSAIGATTLLGLWAVHSLA
jgi:pimeloyl-ACP methyl ester carboxylesterase